VASFPSPNSKSLQDVVSALKKRTKTLKHYGFILSCERLLIIDDGVESEKLELVYRSRHGGYRPSVGCWVWEDNSCWVRASQGSKNGWLWQWDYEGRLFSDDIGRTLVSALEGTMGLVGEMSTDRIRDFDEIWEPILACGPRPVR
jgi:hypothetical protein